MSARRRGPVRQLSLQQSARRPLRRQVSEDCGLRVLASALVLPAPAPAPARPRREHTPTPPRARPVRVAWTEDSPPGVTVQRCRGLPRPVTAKPAPRPPAPPDTILYSRQQLAERLRQAWKDRQRRPNLDIFLAHNSVVRSDDDCHLSVEIVTEVEKNALNSNKNDTNDLRFSPFSENSDLADGLAKERYQGDGSGFVLSGVPTFPTATFPLVSFQDSSDSDKDCLKAIVKPAPPKLTPSITISFDHRDDSETVTNDNEGDDAASVVDVPDTPPRCSDHLLRPDSYPAPAAGVTRAEPVIEEAAGDKLENIKEPERPKSETLTAMMRRANFRNNANNPAMSGSVSTPGTPSAPSPTPSVRPILKKSAPTLTRMMSAPVSRSAPSRLPLTRESSVTREPANDVVDLEHDEEDLIIVQRERNIKSAPARRKFKSVRRRGPKGHDEDSSDEEQGPEETPAAKPKPRKRFVERGADIVTMVSLLSPAESEAEEPPPPLPVSMVAESWSRSDVREVEPHQPPSTPAAATPTAPSALVCLRKFPIKAVSFQQGGAGTGAGGGAVSRSYTASFPSRRGAATPLLVFPPSPPPPPPPPPQLRRRQPVVRAKTLGQESSNEADIPPEPSVTLPSATEPAAPSLTPAPCPRPGPEPPDDNGPDPNAEPTFQTPKEKECWQMFRKMADKGISVSYDTVLRGMLTPTEYRLHKKSMSSAC